MVRSKTPAWLLPLERRLLKQPETTLDLERALLRGASSDGNGNNGQDGRCAARVVHAPAKPRQFSCLPPEVVHKILDDVCTIFRHPHDHQLYYSQMYSMIIFGRRPQDRERKDQRKLFKLLLVSRAWYQLAIELLYRYPVVCTAWQFHAMLNCVRERPRLAECVKTVRLYRYHDQWKSSQPLILKERFLQLMQTKNIIDNKEVPHTDLSALIALCPLAKMVVMTDNFFDISWHLKWFPHRPLLTLAYTGPVVHSRGLNSLYAPYPIRDILSADATFPALESLSGTLIPSRFDLPSSGKLGSLYLSGCLGHIRIPPRSALPTLHTVGIYFSLCNHTANDASLNLISHVDGLRELHLVGPWEHQTLLALPLARFTSLRVLAFGFTVATEFPIGGPILPDGPIPATLSWLVYMTRSRIVSQKQQDMIARHLRRLPMDEFGLKGIHAVACTECPRGKDMVTFCESRGVRLTTDKLILDQRTPKRKIEKEELVGMFREKSLPRAYMSLTSPLDASKRPWQEVLDK